MNAFLRVGFLELEHLLHRHLHPCEQLFVQPATFTGTQRRWWCLRRPLFSRSGVLLNVTTPEPVVRLKIARPRLLFSTVLSEWEFVKPLLSAFVQPWNPSKLTKLPIAALCCWLLTGTASNRRSPEKIAKVWNLPTPLSRECPPCCLYYFIFCPFSSCNVPE